VLHVSWVQPSIEALMRLMLVAAWPQRFSQPKVTAHLGASFETLQHPHCLPFLGAVTAQFRKL
jgi:hypothetical protein